MLVARTVSWPIAYPDADVGVFDGLRVLGPLVVERDGNQVAIGGQRQARVLSVLTTRVGEFVSTSTLVDAVWPEGPPNTFDSALRNQVARIRKLLSKMVPGLEIESSVSHGGQYRLAGPRSLLDLCVFEDLLRPSGAGPTPLELETALSLWRGEPFCGADVVDLLPAIEQLERSRVEAVARLAEHALRHGQPSRCRELVEPFLQENPGLERLCGLAMRALYREGRQADALAAFARTRDWLVESIGADPTPALSAVEYAILIQDESMLDGQGSEPAPPVVAPRSLVAPADSGPLVGRGTELAELIDRLEVLVRGRSVQPRVVVGPAGVGKSRLLAELGLAAASVGVDVVHAWAEPEPLDSFGTLRRLVGSTWPAPLGASAHEVASLLSAPAGPAGRDPDHFSWRVEEALSALVRGVDAVGRPLLAIIDDLQWVDADSARWLRTLVRMAPARMWLVGASRAYRAGGPLAKALRGAEPEITELAPLSRDGVRALIASCGAELSGASFARLFELSGGLPYAVRALLVDRVRTDGSTELVGETANDVPDVVAREVQKQLTWLADQVAEWLWWASLLGSGTASEDVALLADVDLAPDAWHGLVDDGLIDGEVVGAVRFTHELGRIAVLTSRPRAAVADGHARAARLLAKQSPCDEVRLARHALASSLPVGDIVEIVVTAAKAAEARPAPNAARRLYVDVVERLASLDGAQRHGLLELELDALEGLARTLARTGDRDEGFEVLERFISLAASEGRHHRACRAVLALAQGGANLSSGDVMPDLLRRLLLTSTAEKEDRLLVEAELLNWELVHAGASQALRERLDALQIAAADHATIEGRVAVARVEVSLGAVSPAPDERRRVARRGVRLAEGRTDRASRSLWASSMGLWASAAASAGETTKARALLDTLEAGVTRANLPVAQWFVAVGRADLDQQEGRLDEALAAYEDALRMGRAHGHPDATASWLAHMAVGEWLRRPIGDLVEAARGYADVDRTRASFGYAVAALGLAESDPAQARDAVNRVLAATDPDAPHALHGISLVVAAHVASALGSDPDCRAVLLGRLDPFRGSVPRLAMFGTCFGPADRVVGRLLADSGERLEARAALEASRNLARKAGARVWMAWCAHDLAGVVDSADRPRLLAERDELAMAIGLRGFPG